MTSGARLRWMDVLRGAAILLVILSHATRQLSDVVPTVPAVEWLDLVLTPYRMPMLMFLSGMLLPVALAKPLPTYYLGKVRRLLWPYVVWVLVLGLVGAAPGPLLDPRTWYATSYLWYLFFLLCYFAVAPVVRRWPAWLVAAGSVALVLASVPLDGAQDGRVKLLLYLGGFFGLGHVAASLPRLLGRLTTPGTATSTVVVLVGVAPGVVAVSTGMDTRGGVFAVLSLVGVLATVVLAQVAVRVGGTRFVEWVGRNSIVFYTVHFPVLIVVAAWFGGTAERWGPLDGTLLVLGAALLSVAVGAAAAAARYRVAPVDWLFVMPLPARSEAFTREFTRAGVPRRPRAK
jgi:fucose 4-O-acetylase-like acetyltransferase